MFKSRRFIPLSASRSSRGGFTLIELLVVIAIIGILASVTVPAVMNGIAKATQNKAMQSAKQIGTLMFTYSLDNGGSYPPDNTNTGGVTYTGSSGAFEQLINNKYISSADIFCLTGGTAKPYTGGTPGSSLDASNVSWDVTGVATSGISQNAPDQLPLVFSTGNTVSYPAQVGTSSSAKCGPNNPFGKQGIPVCYKGNNAAFMPVKNPDGVTVDNFISASCDPAGVNYLQLKP